jgi:hypothetical protein
MSEIIDLTNDNMPTVIAQPARRPRAPPKCGYCAVPGHTVRSCNDPEVMNTLRQLHQMVNRYPTYETVINWLHTLDVKVLQLIVSKYTYTAYRKNSKQMCIDILSVAISDNYREEERRMMISLQSVFRYGDMLIWTAVQGLQNVPQLYRQYCAQFMEDETNPLPTEEECQILVSSIQNHYISQNISYYTAKRFNGFIMYKYDEFRRGTARTTSNAIKYVLTRKTITIPIQIECPICMETKETPNIITTTCSHQFCKECITNLVHKTPRNRCNCPLCRNPIHKIIQETLQT